MCQPHQLPLVLAPLSFSEPSTRLVFAGLFLNQLDLAKGHKPSSASTPRLSPGWLIESGQPQGWQRCENSKQQEASNLSPSSHHPQRDCRTATSCIFIALTTQVQRPPSLFCTYQIFTSLNTSVSNSDLNCISAFPSNHRLISHGPTAARNYAE